MVDAPKQPYMGDAVIDTIIRMNTELMSELWILRDRVTILEHMLEKQGAISRKELDDFVPTGDLAKELVRERDALVEKVVGGAWTQGFTVDGLLKK